MMNALRNKVQLIGNLGHDPEIVELESGVPLVRFSLATKEVYKNSEGEKVEETQWHPVVAWGKTAEIIQNYVSKGQEIALEGKLVHRSYETDQGEKRYITEVKCQEVLLLQSKRKEKQEA
jgi:single-strand DNA-binding protein